MFGHFGWLWLSTKHKQTEILSVRLKALRTPRQWGAYVYVFERCVACWREELCSSTSRQTSMIVRHDVHLVTESIILHEICYK